VSTSPVIRHARRARAFNLAAVSFSAASALLQVLAFHQVTFWVPVLLVFAAVNVFCAAAGTRNLRRLQARARRPDYAVIARLERGIWGQAFEHAGVPSLPTRPGPPGLPPATVAQRGGYGAAGYLDDLCLYVSRLANSPDPAVRKCARAWLIREADKETRRRLEGAARTACAPCETGWRAQAAQPHVHRFPIPRQDVLDEAVLHLERKIVQLFGIPPAR